MGRPSGAQARLPEYDALGLLAHYGRDVAGAVRNLLAGEPVGTPASSPTGSSR